MSNTKPEKTGELDAQIATTPIAIVGMASILPEARTTQAYWDNILQKIDCVTDVPASRWSVEDYYDPDPNVPDKTYCKRGGFIPDIDFDPMEFGLPPNILEVTDVSQLLALVVAKEALEDAGYKVPGSDEGRDFDRDLAGVVLGVVGISSKTFTPLMSRLQYPVWEKTLISSGVSPEDTQKIIEKIKLAYIGWEENSFPGTIVNVIAGRIANRMDLGGMNCVLDAACGSSLAAVRLAVEELVSHRANMMITGGVDTDNSIGSYLCFSKTPAFSKGEKVRTFDADTDGMMVGEGLAMLVLKRLADAERDGDRIYAVIRGVGASSDGRFKSIYAPRAEGQAKAIRRAYAEAGFPASTVQLFEAHGTGTMAGDPVEVQSLRQVLADGESRPNTVALGSVKSQIAHTKATAGSAGLIKVALALHHKILPPTINVSRPNPKLELDSSPIYINTETRPWIRAQNLPPRRAGVSSFGFGGTNFHVALEEYQAEHDRPYRVHDVPQIIILSASNPAQLQERCCESIKILQSETAGSHFAEIVQKSSTEEIPVTSSRVGFLAENPSVAADILQICLDTFQSKANEETWEHPRGIYYSKTGMIPDGKVVALFAGQGSQYVNMGRELAMNFPPIRQAFSSMDKFFIEDGLNPLSEVVFPVPVFDQKDQTLQTEALQRTDHAQPAIGTMSVGMYKLLLQAGFKPDFVAGHSFGELTALWAGGVYDEDTFLKLAKARGKAMAPPADPNFDAGTMLAVKGDITSLREVLKDSPEITLANYNSNEQVVLAGSKPDIAKIQKTLSEKGFSVIPLPVSAAFHTSLVGHAQKPFAKTIRAAHFQKSEIPVYSNTTGEQYPDDPQAIQKVLEDQILKPVLFKDEIETIYAKGGSIFVEFGPKNILANLVKNILSGRPHHVVSINPNPKKDSDRQFRETALFLKVIGLSLNHIDPYAQLPKPSKPKKKSPMTVTLNGGYYLSEKTRSAFPNALQDGFKIQMPQNGNSGINSEPQVNNLAYPHSLPVNETDDQSFTPDSLISQNIPYQEMEMRTMTADNLSGLGEIQQNGLEQLYTHQSDTLKLHEQYLQNQTEYARTFAEIMKSGYGLFSDGSTNHQPLELVARVLESIERNLARFHDHQNETLRVHEQYLASQAEFTHTFLNLIQASPAPQSISFGQKSQRQASSVAPQPQNTVLTVKPIEVVSPSGPVHQKPTTTPELHGNGSDNSPAQPVQPKSPAASEIALQPKEGITDLESITKTLLNIVSEKTGYPTEMLEMDMDMEADLGIDSIKRVEILGAMQTAFPELPKVENDALSEMHTLRQIIQKLSGNLGQTPTTVEATPVQSSQLSTPAPAITQSSPVSPGSIDAQTITKALLEVVSEKTGYPVEMLELDMDMEADLGIDSIKRVEILGAMQTQFPSLPKVSSDALAELRTLSQIISHLEHLSAANVNPQATPSAPPAQSGGNTLSGGQVLLKDSPSLTGSATSSQ